MTANPLFKKRTSPFILLIAFLLSSTGFAQQTVKASDIMQDIKSGKSISYENVTITGTLDMTFMDEKLNTLPKKRKWYKMGSNSIEEQIENNISFENCVFEDHVYAYFHDEDSGYTFVANFENDVRFSDCTFKGEALFKYSDFESNADFSGSKFDQRTTFKYAEFDTMVSFANTGFKEDAIFKYTEFNEGVSFNNAVFEDDLDIKYMEVKGEFDISNMKVADDIDAKYTSINGKSFSKHLLKNNN
ncbi:MAG: pentapeptide repeat-containing protein [Bacteroidia bacterium]|nr:pentapeptide repeat-containing protein [Bacteroidia bacterium]NND51256.1 pentapeptide repeat-containing protein [Flavobacteriaceae bacterium]